MNRHLSKIHLQKMDRRTFVKNNTANSRLNLSHFFIPAVIAFGFFISGNAQAQVTNSYWNPTNGVGGGGTGQWSSSNLFWAPNSDGSGTLSGPNTNYTYNFGGAAGTVTQSANQTVAGINWLTSGYILNSGAGTRNLAANTNNSNPLVTVADNANVTFVSGQSSGGFNINLLSMTGGVASTVTLNASSGTNLTVLFGSSSATGGKTNFVNTIITGSGNIILGSLGTFTQRGNITNNSTGALILTNGSSGDTLYSGSISGAGPLTLSYASSGKIILSSSNNYSGGTTVFNTGTSSGYIGLLDPNALGAGSITIAGGTVYFRTMANNFNITNSFAINAGTTLQLAVSNSAHRSTWSGPISGPGGVLYQLSDLGLYLTSTNSSFGGGVTVGSSGVLYFTSMGIAGANSSLGTNGTISISTSGSSGPATLQWLGTNNEISDKTISLTTSSANANPGFRIYAGDNSQGGTNLSLTLNGNITTAGTSANKVITLAAYNTNTLILNGWINAPGLTNSVVIGIAGQSGTVVLGNANNNFGAPISLALGSSSTNILQVAQIGNSGANSPLGTNGTISIGGASTTGLNVLRYTGNGETSDKTLNHSGTGGDLTLDQSGTGNLKFTSPMSATGTSPKTVVLQGSTAGTGELSGNINDLGGNVTSLTKRGTGTWILSGSNSYSGLTTISSGALRIMGANSVPVGGVLVGSATLGNNATLDVGSAGNYVFNSFGNSATAGANMVFTNSSGSVASITFTNATNYITLSSGTSAGRTISNSSTNLQVTFAGAVDVGSSSNQTITFSGAGNIAINGTLFNNGTSNSLPSIRSIVKTGTGVISLAGNNSGASGYNGTTTISAGILSLDAAGALGTNSVVLDGGTLRVNTTGTNDSKGNLTLNTNSTIDLGTLSGGAIRFATATSSSWAGTNNLLVANSSGGAKLYITETNNVALARIKSAENPTATASFTAEGLLTFSAAKTTPTISQAPTAGSITYGQTLANSSLSGGTASVAGTFAFTTPSTAPSVGTSSQGVTFTPTDTANYNTVTTTVSVTVNKATPAISQAPTAGSITYGQTLADSSLSGGTASVAGTFAFTTPSTAPSVGTSSQGVTFTPADTTNYNTVTTTVSVTVNNAGPTLTDSYPGSTPLGINPQNGLTYLMSYALGGDSSNAPTLPTQVTSDASKLTLEAIVRTNDSNVSVIGEAVGGLADYATPSAITSVSGSTSNVSQSGVPTGCQRQQFSVNQGSDDKKFLRLKAIKQ